MPLPRSLGGVGTVINPTPGSPTLFFPSCSIIQCSQCLCIQIVCRRCLCVTLLPQAGLLKIQLLKPISSRPTIQLLKPISSRPNPQAAAGAGAEPLYGERGSEEEAEMEAETAHGYAAEAMDEHKQRGELALSVAGAAARGAERAPMMANPALTARSENCLNADFVADFVLFCPQR